MPAFWVLKGGANFLFGGLEGLYSYHNCPRSRSLARSPGIIALSKALAASVV